MGRAWADLRKAATRRRRVIHLAFNNVSETTDFAAAFEIDDVIDPAQTRHVLIETLARTRS